MSVQQPSTAAAKKKRLIAAQQLGISLEELDKRIPEGTITAKRKLFLKVSTMSDIEVKRLLWAMRPILLAASLNLFTGDPDIGKTLVAIFYIAALSKLGKHTVIICREDSYETMWKPRLYVAGAVMENIHAVEHVGVEGTDEEIPWMLDNPAHLSLLHDLIALHKATLCLIDPLADLAGSLNLNASGDVRKITGGLGDIAKKTGVAMLVNCHTTKAIVDQGIKAAAGSFQISASVQVSWLFMENRDVKGERLMLQGRNKGGRKRSFKYEIISVPWPEEVFGKEDLLPGEESDGIGLVVFKGVTDLTANDVLEQKQEKGESKIARCSRFVGEMLANGPKLQTECWIAARAFFDTDAINKACTRLKVVRDLKTWTLPAPPVKEKPAEELLRLEEKF